ncbi:DUF2997 domain-containing protein [Nitrospira calida]|jgi:hypothetical protein
MSEPTIEIAISPEGEVEVKVAGCAGPACADLTKAIEQALGRVTADRKTPEYFRQETSHVRH